VTHSGTGRLGQHADPSRLGCDWCFDQDPLPASPLDPGWTMQVTLNPPSTPDSEGRLDREPARARRNVA
jgi:hypothetical protein